MTKRTFDPSIADDLAPLDFGALKQSRNIPRAAPAAEPALEAIPDEIAPEPPHVVAPASAAAQVVTTAPSAAAAPLTRVRAATKAVDEIDDPTKPIQIGPEIDDAVRAALRKAQLRLKGEGPGTSVGDLTLQAVANQQQSLAHAWTDQADEVPEPANALFPGLEVKAEKRKARSAIKRTRQYMLIRRDHLQRIDELQKQWGAPSRAELLEEALRLQYLPKSSRRVAATEGEA